MRLSSQIEWHGIQQHNSTEPGEDHGLRRTGRSSPEEYPNLVELLATGGADWDHRFAFGMDALIRGLEPLRTKKRPDRAR